MHKLQALPCQFRRRACRSETLSAGKWLALTGFGDAVAPGNFPGMMFAVIDHDRRFVDGCLYIRISLVIIEERD
jgi:hypothetical protein